MYHTIAFVVDRNVALEVSPRQPLERVLIKKGLRLQAQVKPYVVETSAGPVEVADLFFEEGTATRQVPFACFQFTE